MFYTYDKIKLGNFHTTKKFTLFPVHKINLSVLKKNVVDRDRDREANT